MVAAVCLPKSLVSLLTISLVHGLVVMTDTSLHGCCSMPLKVSGESPYLSVSLVHGLVVMTDTSLRGILLMYYE